MMDQRLGCCGLKPDIFRQHPHAVAFDFSKAIGDETFTETI